MNYDSATNSQNLETIPGETELSPPELFAANLIEWALERHASDLFLSDIDGAVLVSVRRLGRIEPVRKLASTYGHRLQAHLRVMTGADSGDSIRPVEGRGMVTTPDGSIAHLRLSCIPTLFGQDVAIRLFDPVRSARAMDDLGMDSVDVESIARLTSLPSGLILVTGPVASGKSSTLYAMLDRLNDGSRKIHTIEDPIEYSLAGIVQSQINKRQGLDFADFLSAVLRHSPDVIMIGEVRDRVTAETAVRAGASGQLVLATVHSESASEAIDMMLQYGCNHQFLASALIGVINQRLVRRLCPECRQLELSAEGISVPDRIRNRVGDSELSVYRPGGCSLCHECGYDSLVSMPEILTVDTEIARAIANRVNATELESIAADRGMLRLPDVARSYVVRGIISSDEANRVVRNPIVDDSDWCISAANESVDQ